MEAVFQLGSPVSELPKALAERLAGWGLRASPLDPSVQGGPLSGWYRIESTDADRLHAAVQFLQSHASVDAAYVKPEEGPPA